MPTHGLFNGGTGFEEQPVITIKSKDKINIFFILVPFVLLTNSNVVLFEKMFNKNLKNRCNNLIII